MSNEHFNDAFDGQLQQFLAWEASDVAGAPTSSDVAAIVLARTDRRTNRRLSPQLMWIALTGLLIAALVGAAVGGAVLVRMLETRNEVPVLPVPDQTPTVTPQPSQTSQPSPSPQAESLTVGEEPLANYCGPAPNEEYAVQFAEEIIGSTGDEQLVLVGKDGTVLTGRRFVTFDGGLRQRRLNEDGLAQLTGLVEAANLPDCQAVAVDDPEASGSLALTTGDNPVQVWFGGSRSRQLRRTSESEATAIANLFAQLRDLDSAIDPSGWRDPDWSTYRPDQWKLAVQLLPSEPGSLACTVAEETDEPAPSLCIPWAANLLLPDGTRLLDFGTNYPAPSLRDLIGGYRCAVLDRDAASELPVFLHLSQGVLGPNYGRDYTNGFDTISVSLVGMLPGDRGCEYPVASEPQQPPPTDLAPAIDACEVIRVGLPTGPGALFPYTAGGEGWWKRCVDERDPGNIHVWVRGRSTSAADAEAYARSLFGEGVTTEEILGRTIYWNDCFEADAGCTPSAALSSEPHLIVFSWLGQAQDDFRSMIERALEADVIP